MTANTCSNVVSEVSESSLFWAAQHWVKITALLPASASDSLWIGLSGDLWDRVQWHTWDSECVCPVQSEQHLWELRILSAAALHFPLLGQCPYPPWAFTKFVGCVLWYSLVQIRCEEIRAVSLWYGSTRTLGMQLEPGWKRRRWCSHLK